jgi:hypothetical protein
VTADLEAIEGRQEEHRRQYEEECKTKVGVDASKPWHPVLNPTQDELDHREQLQRESIEQDRLKHLSDTQQEYYRKAVELVRTGTVKSLVDLGQRFTWSYGRHKGKSFGPLWARDLIKKMTLRGTFTEEQLKQLIADHTIPKRSKQSTKKQEN